MTPERKAELQSMLELAKGLSSMQYWEMFQKAFGAEWHALIEFNGVIREYINICGDALEQDIDFTHVNIHVGGKLPIKEYRLAYLNDKIECIFAGALKLAPAAP